MNEIYKKILAQSKSMFDELIQIRRHIHQNPELSFKEFLTAEFIRDNLRKVGIEYKTIAETGTVALIGKGEKCVALRADIDALPINEETNLEYASKNKGVMHACGHDMHSTMLLGAARILKGMESELTGTVKIIFQPGEEKLPGGASNLIEEGVLENPKVTAMFAQHIFPEEETGTISVNSCYIMASADELYWTLKGKGTHAAQPHLGNDCIMAASQLVINLQSIVTKYKNPIKPGLLSVTSIQGGSATNAFPDEVKLMGTFRANDEEWRSKMHDEIRRITNETCSLFGIKGELEIVKGYPALYNNPETTEMVNQTAKELLGQDSVKVFEPKLWAEDFAYYAQKIPSTFWFLGIRPKDIKDMPPLHNSKLIPDEKALTIGAAMLAGTAVNYINNFN
ncbi:MAG: amidohydrolase [Bacteroidetes bacterium]|nr:MAG: amidohydrolase [Bacteroidota bacterium]